MNVGGLVRKHPRADAPAKHERGKHPEHRHEHRGQPNPEHVGYGRFKADFEEEDDHAETREHLHGGIRFDAAEPTDSSMIEAAKYHTGDQFSEYGWLTGSNGQMSAELG